MITVVNKKDYTELGREYEIYIGRPSILGNQFDWKPNTAAMWKATDREDSIRKYEDLLRKRLASPKLKDHKNELRRLYRIWQRRGHLTLVCWCAPLACHGDVLKKILLEMRADEIEAGDPGSHSERFNPNDLDFE